MKESEKIALGITIGIVIAFLIIVVLFQYDKINKADKQKIYDTAYLKGYLKGKEDGVQLTIEAQHEINEQRLNELTNKK